jgi:hypothetical protein
MSTPNAVVPYDLEPLSQAWVTFAHAVGIPANYNGNSAPEAHAGAEAAQELLRGHICETTDYRLFNLLHLLGNASLRMEQVIDPKEYVRTTLMVEAALADAELNQEHWLSEQEIEAHLAHSLLRRD